MTKPKTRKVYRYTGDEAVTPAGYHLLPGRFISEMMFRMLPPAVTIEQEIHVK